MSQLDSCFCDQKELTGGKGKCQFIVPGNSLSLREVKIETQGWNLEAKSMEKVYLLLAHSHSVGHAQPGFFYSPDPPA